MTLEDRLSTVLQDAADAVPTSGALSGPEDRALRRRRNRRTTGSILTTAVVIVASVGVYRVARPSGSINVAADRQPATTLVRSAAEATSSRTPEPSDRTPTVTARDVAGQRGLLSAYAGVVPADTGPELQWIEVAPPDDWDGGPLVWTGTQFVGAVHRAESVDLIASTDGSGWSTVGSLPGRPAVPTFAASGDQLVAWTEGISEVFSSEVFLSDDRGQSWVTLGSIPAPEGSASDYVTRRRHISTAAVGRDTSGQSTVVLATAVANDLDVHRLLADNGLAAPADAGVAYSLEPDGSGMVSVCADPDCSSEQTYTLTELGLPEEALKAVVSEAGSTELWRSGAGGTVEQVPVDVSGHTTSLNWVADHFVLVAADENQSTLARSTDGVTWEPVALPPSAGVGSTLVATDAAVYLGSWDDMGHVNAFASFDGGRTWGDQFALPVPGGALEGGPSGLVAVSAMENPPLKVSKDGFTVSLANQGVLVIDQATDETVLSFDVAALSAEDAPETVIYQEDPYQLTFLRPGSLEPLVTVTEADLFAADPRQGMSSDFVLGWSADGSTWGWQSAAEAFGISAWPSIVIGDGVVLGIVYENAAEDGTAESAVALPRMFMAKTR